MAQRALVPCGLLILVASLMSTGCGGFAAELGESFAEGALDELNHRLYDESDDEWGTTWDSRSVAPQIQTRSAGGCSAGEQAVVRTTAGNSAVLQIGSTDPIELSEIAVNGPDGSSLARIAGPLKLPLRLALDLDPNGGDGQYDLLVGSSGQGSEELAAAAGAELQMSCTGL